MNDYQTNRVNSLIKSSDFLTDHAGDIAAIAQLPPMATQLATIIKDIETAAGKGNLDLTGVAELKSVTRQKLLGLMLKVARGGAAYYLSTGNTPKLRIVDYNDSEVERKRDNDLYATAKELHQMATVDGASYIGLAPSDITDLDSIKEDFFSMIQNPKREVEIAAQHNALIEPLITDAMNLRTEMDIYMRTFIATNPFLYNEWKASNSIDDTGATNLPVYTITKSIPAGTIKAIDYSAVALQGNTEIKLINNSPGPLEYGFGNDDASFNSTEIVSPGLQKRRSAASLGYNALTERSLNVRNTMAVDLDCTIEFYDMS